MAPSDCTGAAAIVDGGGPRHAWGLLSNVVEGVDRDAGAAGKLTQGPHNDFHGRVVALGDA